MSCARYRAQLSLYLDDELTARQRSELLAHIAGCAECAATLARFRQSEVLLKKLPESQPSGEVRAAIVLAARQRKARQGLHAHLGWWLSLGGRINPRFTLGAVLTVTLALVVALIAQLSPTLPARLGFAPTITPTSSYLDVPASSTPLPGGAVAPRLVSSVPFDGERDVDVYAPLVVRFDQAMDRRAVEHALRLQPPAPGTFAWDADNELQFRPGALGLLRGVTYTVALADGARSLGGASLPSGPLWSFATREPPRLLAVQPAPLSTATVPTATLVLTFSQPMDAASVERVLRLRGTTVGGTAWQEGGTSVWSDDGRVLRYTPAAPLPPGQVAVLLGAGGQDRLGGGLLPAAWEFMVAPGDAQITLGGPRLLALSTGGAPPAILYNTVAGAGERPLPHVTFTLYALPDERFLALLPALLADRTVPASGPWPLTAAAGLTPLRTWTASPAAAGGLAPGDGRGQTVLPVREAGTYLLTAEAPGARGDSRVLVLGDLGVAAVADGDGWLIWTAALGGDAGAAVARVRLFAPDGTLRMEGDSDRDGLFRMRDGLAPLPVLALAERGGVRGFTWLDGLPAPPTGPALAATLLTDRPAYAPGDTLNFAAVLLAGSAATDATVSVRLRAPAGPVLGALALKPDRSGAVAGSFALAAGLTPGVYPLEMALGDAVRQVNVAVGVPAARPALTLALATPPPAASLFAGDPYSATLTALDPTGAPVPGTVITWTVRGGAAGDLPAGNGVTDAAGRVPLALRLPLPADPDQPLVLDAQAAGPAGEATQRAVALPPVRGRLDLMLDLSGQAFTPGSSLVLTATVRDAAGTGRAGQPVVTGLYVRGPAGQADPFAAAPGTTDGAGQLTTTLALPLQGSFLVRAVTTDSTGIALRAEARLWVYESGSGTSWAMPVLSANDLLVTADAPAYAPGGTARLLVQPGTPGPVLAVATLDGRAAGQQVAILPPNGSVLQVPVPAAAPAGARLTVTLVRFSARGEVRLGQTQITLPVAQPAAQLTVEIIPDHTDGVYVPGSTLSATVRLRDGLGQPVAGQVVLAVRPAGTADPTAPDGPTVLHSTQPGAAGAPAALAAAAPATYWNAGLVTNATGEARAAVPLPADGGPWQLVAWGFAPNGPHTTAAVPLTLAPVLDLRWDPPAALTSGDVLQLRATARNMTTATLQADVRLRAEGSGLSLGSPGLLPLVLAPGESRALLWTVEAGGAGAGQLVLEGGWGATVETPAGVIRRPVPVRVAAYGLPVEVTQAGTGRTDSTSTLTLPADAPPGGATLDIRADAAPAGALGAALVAITTEGAGQGPIEAVAARLTGGVAVSRLFRLNGLPADALPDNLAAARLLDMQYLATTQNADGSWGVVPGAPGEGRTTAVLLEALALFAAERSAGGLADGLPLDQGIITRAVAWLGTTAAPPPLLPGAPATPPPADDLTRQAHVLYVLSRYDSADRETVRRLLAADLGLRPAARGWLALALDGVDAHNEALTLLDAARLLPPEKGTEATAYTALDGAVALQALLTVGGGSDELAMARLAPWLLDRRQGPTWDTPETTAAALQALAAWAARLPPGGAAVGVRVLVNGGEVKAATLSSRGAAAGLAVTVPGSALRAGANTVRLLADGPTPIYYSLRLTALRNPTTRPLLGEHAPDFAATLLRAYAPAGGGWQPGVAATETITLTLGEAVPGLILRDPRPAALYPVGAARLERVDGTSSGSDRPALLGSVVETGQATYTLGPLGPGTYRLSLPATVRATGTFTALPVWGQVPGTSARWAQSGGYTLTVTERGAKNP